MKKLVSILVAAALVCLSLTAFAAVDTPFDNDSLKIAVVEKFEADDYSVYVGIPEGVKPIDELTGIEFGGAFKILPGANNHAWAGVLSPDMGAYNATGAVGFGFYVKNGTSTNQAFSFILTTNSNNLNVDAYTIASNGEYALVAKDGTTTYVTAPENFHPYTGEMVQSYFQVPVDFEGYIFVPFASTCKLWSALTDTMTDSMTFKAVGWMGSTDIVDEDGLIFDNFFFYGNIDEVDADLIAVGEEPTTEPTPAPTEPPTETADVSVIAYAMAAIAGCGALAIRKRRK